MRTRFVALAVVSPVLLFACGKGAAPAPEADVAAQVPPETRPATLDSDAVATAAADPDATASASADPDAAATVAADPDAAAVDPDVVVAAPGFDLHARIATGLPGCVGLSEDGQMAVVIAELAQPASLDRAIVWTTIGPEPDEGRLEFPTCTKTDAAEAKAPFETFCAEAMQRAGTELQREPPLMEAIGSRRFVACTRVAGSGVARPMGVGVKASVKEVPDRFGRAIVAVREKAAPDAASSEGKPSATPFTVFEWNGDPADDQVRPRLSAGWLHYAETLPNTFVEMTLDDPDSDEPSLGEVSLQGAPGFPLGLAPCVPRPHLTRAPAATPPEPASMEEPCLGMTADGRSAAFVLSRKTWEGTDEPPEAKDAQWFGPGPHPAIDLGCFEKGCTEAQQAKLAAAFKEAGIVACPDIDKTLVIDGHTASLTTDDDALWLEVDGRQQWLRLWATGHDGSDHERFERAYQRPDGPLYVLIGNSDTGLEETRLAWYALGPGLGLCAPGVTPGAAPAPSEAKADPAASPSIAIAEVRSGPVQPDSGEYTFAATNLVDGKLDTSWQPRAKPGETGASVELVLAAETEVGAIEIGNGFQRSDRLGDLFLMNARAKRATLTFSDGSTESLTFASDARGLTRFEFKARATKTLTLSIVEAHAGTRWASDLALSELRVPAAKAPATPTP